MKENEWQNKWKNKWMEEKKDGVVWIVDLISNKKLKGKQEKKMGVAEL